MDDAVGTNFQQGNRNAAHRTRINSRGKIENSSELFERGKKGKLQRKLHSNKNEGAEMKDKVRKTVCDKIIFYSYH